MSTLEEFLQKYNIAHMYKYIQHHRPNAPKEIEFGWGKADKLDLKQPIIMTSGSISDTGTSEEKAWSEKEGANAVTLEDYNKYFKALVGLKPQDFLNKWESSPGDFIKQWYRIHPNSQSGSAEWIVDIANLICNDKEFTRFGRDFKKINP